ncbi:MAG: c-type cytochrome domain-containing protein, partial [Planctomycetaceae bacterium]
MSHRRIQQAVLLFSLTGLFSVTAIRGFAAEPPLTPAQSEFFEKRIRPNLVKYCYECHSIETGKTRGGLLVDTREGLLQGGDSGPAIISRDLDNSV